MDQVSEKDKSNPRTTQACQRCRSLKARCIPSAQDGECQRCFKSKRECVWASSLPRVVRARGPSRISQVERKIDGLLERITEQKPPNHTSMAGNGSAKSDLAANEEQQTLRESGSLGSAPLATLPDRSYNKPSDEADESMKQLEGIAKLHQFDAVHAEALEYKDAPSVKEDPKSDEILVRTYLETTEAEGLLDEYRSMFPSIPFVPISVATTAQDLRSQKPILLLAIMTVASWRNREFQAPLERQLRSEIASRAIMKPRKDIVLIQSILVYLSWCHQLTDHGMHDMATFSNLCIGVAYDIKIDPRARSEITPRKRTAIVVAQSKQEEQRTLLGCYYVSSMIANGFRNPNLLKCSRYMLECSEMLQKSEEFESDRSISLLTRLRRVEDQMFDQYCSNEVFSTSLNDSQIMTHIESWEWQLRELHQEIKSAERSELILLTYHAIEMEIYIEAIHRVFNPAANQLTEHPISETLRTRVVSSCLEAGKAVLDGLIAIPAEDYHLIPTGEWLRLPRTVMVMIMISTKMTNELVGWDLNAAQDRIRLDLYLESLCFRMQNLTTFKPPKQSRPDFWMAMKTVMQSIRGWYKQKLEPAGSTSIKLQKRSTRALRCPVHDKESADSSTPRSADISSTTSHSSGMPPQTPTTIMGSGDPFNLHHGSSSGQSYDPLAPWMPPYADMSADADQFMNLDYWQGACPFDSMNFEF